MFPEFYASYLDDESGDLTPTYYKVTGYDGKGGHVFWWQGEMDRPREYAFYDLFLIENKGLGVERCSKSETPWADE